MRNILVVDDNKDMADHVNRILTDEGYNVSIAADADEALESLKRQKPDLFVLDVRLPGLSGLKLCEILRKDVSTAAIPILMLTVLHAENQKVQGLESGADDYLTKPFGSKELAARVNALLRRVSQHTPLPRRVIHAGDVVLDLDKHTVLSQGKDVKLSPKEFDLLTVLLQAKGRVLSRQHLLDCVWGYNSMATSETLKQHIKNLRKKLGLPGEKIQAVVNLGYKFADG